jgi:cobalamin biosynthesis Mg chelatase CobN
MWSTPNYTRGLLFIVIALCVLGAGSLFLLPTLPRTLAQDEPTDRPFPTSVPQTESATVAVSPSTVSATNTPAAGSTQSATQSATQASTLTIDNIKSTSVAAQAQVEQLRAQNKALQDTVNSAQNDKGATLYALVIVVIGLMLAFAVFFGLRRSGNSDQ